MGLYFLSARSLNAFLRVVLFAVALAYLCGSAIAQTGTFSPQTTNLGSVAVNPATAATTTLTFTFSAGGSILAPAVLTVGAKNLDFTDAGTGTCTTNGTSYVYSGGNSCTVVVNFNPKVPGTRYGAVVLYNSSDTAIATAYLYGTGTGPLMAFSNQAQTALGGGFEIVEGAAVDGNGNLFVGDVQNRALKEIPAGCQSSSCVTTIVSDLANGIDGVAIDGAGNLYFTNYVDAAIEVPQGCTSYACLTVLGGAFKSQSVAVDRSGNVFVGGKSDNTGEVLEIPPGCTSSSCVVTLASGLTAYGIAVDGADNVYLATSGRAKILEIPSGCTSASCITDVGGGFASLRSVTVDGVGNIYAADYPTDTNDGGLLHEFPPGCASPTCVTLLSSGFEAPSGLAVGGRGNIYVVNVFGTTALEINRVTPPTLGFAATAAGDTSSDSPQTVTIENLGNEPLTFPVPSSGDNPTTSTNFTLTSGGEGDCPLASSGGSAGTLAANSNCNLPISFTPETGTDGTISGSLVLRDTSLNAAAPNYATQTIPLYGSVPQTFASGGDVGAVAVNSSKSASLSLTFTMPVNGTIGVPAVLTQGIKNLDFTDAGTGTCTTNGTSHVYTAGATCTVVVKFVAKYPGPRYGAVVLYNSANTPFATTYIYGVGTAPQIAFSSAPEITLNGGFGGPGGVALDAAGNLYVADTTNQAVKEMPPGCASSSCVIILGGGFSAPNGLAVDGAGDVLVADTSATVIKKIPHGCVSFTCVTTLGGGLDKPAGIAVDMGGNAYVLGNGIVSVVPVGCDSSSCVTTVGGTVSASSLALDKKGDVFVSGADGVWKIPPGCMSSSCSTQIYGGYYSLASGVALDGSADVYFFGYFGDELDLFELPNGCASSSCKIVLLTNVGLGNLAVGGSGNIYFTQYDESYGYNSPDIFTLERSTPPSLTFAPTEDGGVSKAQTVTIQNIGNETLTFPIPSSGNNPSISANFTLNSDKLGDCPLITSSSTTAGTLLATSTCTLPITFTPGSGVTGDDVPGTLVLTDTSLNAASPGYVKQTIPLTGTATAP